MEPETIAISKFKASCLALLKRVKQSGKSLLVTRQGEPIALVSPPPLRPNRASWLGSQRHAGEVVSDLIEPALPPEAWAVLKADEPLRGEDG